MIQKTIFFCSAALIAAATSCGGKAEKPANAGQQGPVAVDVIVLQPQKIDDKLIAPGSILPNEEVELKSETSGRITHIYFDEGSRVKKGELLVKINDSELRAQLEKQQLQLRLAEEELFRQTKLYEINGISKGQLDVATLNVENIKADISLLGAQIDKTEIRAPFNGQVGLKSASTGAYLAPGTAVAWLVQNDPVKIEFTLPEKYAGDLEPGMQIGFTTSQAPRESHQAAIYAIEPRIDMGTRSVRIRARCKNPNGTIVPGAFADISVRIKELDQALMVPSEALVQELEGQKVFQLKDGKVNPVKVITGIRTSRLVQLESGLAPGDTVIVTGLLQVRPGMPVVPKQVVDINSLAKTN